jgi:hypothetical protein
VTDLLIHSMTELSDIILGTLHAAGARNLAEVGAEFGGMSQQLAAYAKVTGGTLTSIDPAPKREFVDWVNATPEVRHIPAPSLEAMPGLCDIDAWVIDGDHNYYTVFNELRIADELARRDGKPLLCLLHDVSWPCARRDFYYAPDRIPAEWRHPHSFENGVTLGNKGTLPGRGFRGNGQFAVALHEGGPRNGVLTAVEDFIKSADSEQRPLAYANVPAVFGLGVLFDNSAPWAAKVTQVLQPWHNNQLIATLELNRLRNYLTVIDWQDRQAA